MAKKKNDSVPDKALDALLTGKTLTAANRKVLRAFGEAIIDDFMKHVGYADPASRTDGNGWRHLQLESAEGIAGITEGDGEMYLHVEAVIMKLPSDRDLIQALMREALELNCKMPGVCSVGIRDTELLASATENMRTLRGPRDFAQLIGTVMALANSIDDDFKQKYGGTTKSRRKPELAKTA